MKKNRLKYLFILLFSLSVFSTIYLNEFEEVHSDSVSSIEDMKEDKDQLIAQINFVSLVVDKVLDIVTTRKT